MAQIYDLDNDAPASVVSGTLWVQLFATASGTGVMTPILCDDLGMLLISGVN